MNKKLVKICIFGKNSTPSAVKQGNGDAILDNICKVAISDEFLFTGEYYLDAIFLVDDKQLHKHLDEEAILKVQLDYGNEYFRIAKIKKNSKDIALVARQITISETCDMWLEDVRPTNQNGQGAISYIKDNSKGKKDIKVFSDIQDISTAYYMDMNVYESLHTCEQSFLNRWGGEIQRRGYDLTINKRIGKHRGVQIRSNKNLTGFEANTNIDTVVTRIKPKGFDGITIGGYVDSPLIENYSAIKTRELKYEDIKVKTDKNQDEGFDTLEEAQQELIKRSELEFSKNHIDKIRASYRLNFIQLEYTEEYKNYIQAERTYLGDSIDVYEDKLDIDITVRIVRRRFDILKQRVIDVELSNEVKKDKPPTIGDVLDKLDKIEGEFTENNKWYQDAINNATDLIQNGLKDSYVITRKNEILILDTPDMNTAINVWRWNKGGLGHSKTGYYGDYETAITQDGSIVAKFLTGLVVNGEQINAKNLNSINNEGTKTLEVTSGGDIILRPKILEILAGSSSNVFTKDEVDKKVNDAKKEINSNIEDVQGTVNDLKDYTDGAFKDNLLTEDEKSKISGFLKPLETELADVTKEYNTIYSNNDLIGEYKTNLKNSYDSYKLKYDGLITTINALLILTVITEENKLALDIAYTDHDIMLANYRQRVNEAIDNIAIKKSNDTLAESKTYTNTQFEIVDGTIQQKVSKTEYDENNNVIDEKFAQQKIEADKINQTVSEIKGDYVNKTTFEQTKDDFSFKFENSGKPNELYNSDFSQILRGWEISNFNSDCFVEYSEGYSGEEVVGCYSLYSRLHNESGTCYAVQRFKPRNSRMNVFTVAGCYHYDNVSVIKEDPYPLAYIYVVIVNTDGTREYYNQDDVMRNNNWISWVTHHRTFARVDNKEIDFIEFYVYMRNVRGNFRITNLDFHEGSEHRKWRPSGEIYSNTMVIDGEGWTVKHNNGAQSRATHECMEFINSQGNRSMRMANGGLNMYTENPNEMVGFIKPAINTHAWLNGVTLSTYNSGDFVSIGHSSSSDENSWTSWPSIAMAKRDFTGDGVNYLEGTNFLNQMVHFRTRTHLRHILDVATEGGFEFRNNSGVPHKMFNSSANAFCLFGDNQLILGYREGEVNKTAIEINEQSSTPILSWKHWDFNGWTMHNMRQATTLQAQSEKLRARKKDLNDAYGSYTMTDGEIRYVCREEQSINSISIDVDTKEVNSHNELTLLVELPQILSENIESDYHLSIGKLSWGDYRIVEKNQYYFIIESNVDNFRFTYEIVGKQLFNSHANAIIASMQYRETENMETPDTAKYSFLENDEMPMWYRYTKQYANILNQLKVGG